MSSLREVLVVDDHPLFREALRSAVSLAYPSSKVVESASIDEALTELESRGSFDIALVDLKIPGITGFDGLLQLRRSHPRLPILIVSGLDDIQIIKEAIGFGAAGYVPKSVDKELLGIAIETVLEGNVYLPPYFSEHQLSDKDNLAEGSLTEKIQSLTPQQLRVLRMLREGLLNKQIASELEVGNSTIKKHVSEILRKLNVNSRTQAVIEVSKLDQKLFYPENSEFGS